MGLDMYLRGRKLMTQRYVGDKEKAPKMDGFFISEVELELGYWRKHPNLHGFIVQTFAKGNDNCQQIDLSAEDLRRIITGIEARLLPHTQGFFFGTSAGTKEEQDEDLAVFRAALEWVTAEDPDKNWRSVYYQASW